MAFPVLAAASLRTAITTKLPQLQNLIKRDPGGYIEEFLQQNRHFQSELAIVRLDPTKSYEKFCGLVTFLSHVAPYYPDHCPMLPTQLMTLLQQHGQVLHQDTRVTTLQALLLLRNRGLLEAAVIFPLLFELFELQDKALRSLAYQHLVSDIRKMHAAGANSKQTRDSQALVCAVLSSQAREPSAKRALDLLVDLYRRRIWTDERCVNAIAQACLSKCTKIAVKAMHFFLGIETKMTEDDETDASKADKVQVMTHQHSKKTKKRARMTQKQEEKKRKMQASLGKGTVPLFPALQMIRDPQGLCEKLFRRLRASNEGFEVRLLMMNMVSRLIGCHQLVLLSFYGFVQRYLSNHQKEVTQILAFLVQASHELVPPDELVPLIRSVAFNFITERCAEEVMAVGLNAIREVCGRVPAVLLEANMSDLMQDLVMYTRSHDKSVKMAARGLINLVREKHPGVLRGKDRGKFHSKGSKPLAYGEMAVPSGVEGAELLEAYERGELDVDLDGSDSEDSDSDSGDGWKKPKQSTAKKQGACEVAAGDGWEEASDESEEGEGEWAEVGDDEMDEDGESASESGEELGDEIEEDAEEDDSGNEDEEDELEEEVEVKTGKSGKKKGAPAMPLATGKKVGIDATRILTDEDFATIRRLREELGMGAHFKGHSDEGFAATALEGYKVKRRATIEEKMATVLEGRNKFTVGGHAGGLTNKEKVRTKNFTMLRHSMKVKRKLQDSGKKIQHQANKQVKRIKKDSKDSKKRRRT